MEINKQLELELGSTLPIVIHLLTDSGKTENLTGKLSAALFVIKESTIDEESILSVAYPGTLDIVAGSIELTLTQTQANSLKIGTFPSQLHLTFTGGDTATTEVFYTKIKRGVI